MSDTLKLLGPLVVEVSGKRVSGFRSAKTMAILAYLATEQHEVSRDFLSAMFWPDASPTQGRAHLRRALYDLAHKLPGWLDIDTYLIRFDPAHTTDIDLSRFVQYEVQGDLDSLLAAAELCRGQFLEGIALEDCPAFELWVTTQREIWHRREAAVLKRIQEHYVRLTRFGDAVDVGWKLVQLQPWREETYQQLMILLARIGDPGQAVKVYRRCRRALMEELGVEPSTETEALCQRIRALKGHASTNIPPRRATFVGRDRELNILNQYLADPSCRLVSVVGPSGIGKTALAVESGARANGPDHILFLDGVCLVRLEETATVDGVNAAIGRALGIVSAGRNASLDLISHYLRPKELLLILDDCPGKSVCDEIIEKLLDAAPHVKLLITTVDRLRIDGEWTITVDGLSTEACDAESGLSEAERLLHDRLLHFGRSDLSPEEAVFAREICRLFKGMPLAIELAATHLRDMISKSAVRAITEDINALSAGEGHLTRHSSMRAAIEYTLNRLNDEERESLLALSILPGGFTAEEASSVADVTPRQLSGFVERLLVSREPAGSESAGECYHMHPLIRQYAREMLAMNPARYNALVQTLQLYLLSNPEAAYLSLPANDAATTNSFVT